MLQSVVPSLHELAREGEVGQTKITQYSRYLTLALALLNSIGYLFLFKGYGINFNGAGAPEIIFDILIVGTLTAGAMLIMWIGELITQRGIGNGMSLIIFANIMAGLPAAIVSSAAEGTVGIVITAVIFVVILCVIPLIVYLERGQRRIPVQYAKRVVGRRMMGGQSTYLPIKVNTAGVVPIIFASALLYFPAQLAVFFPGIGWVQAVAGALASGWINWILNVVLIVFFAYFYTSMVFNPDETADNLKKQGGFIPGVRPRQGHGRLHQERPQQDHPAQRDLPGAYRHRAVHRVLVHGQPAHPVVWRHLGPHHGRRGSRYACQGREPAQDV